MLHFCNIQANAPSEFFTRYLKNQSDILGLDYIQGFGQDALRNERLYTKDGGVFGSGNWSQGITGEQEVYNMNFAFEGGGKCLFRPSSAPSAPRAPMRCILTCRTSGSMRTMRAMGMTCQQGLGLYFKELRETLDQNGLEHVAIATEGLPHEITLPYVDLAQMARDKTIELLFTGFLRAARYGLADSTRSRWRIL